MSAFCTQRLEPEVSDAHRRERLIKTFDLILAKYLPKGVTALEMEPGRPLTLVMGERRHEVEEVVISKEAAEVFACLLISENQHKPFDEVDDDDIRQAAKGSILHDVVLPKADGGALVRSLRCGFTFGDKGLCLELILEPPFVAGYGQVVDPARAPSEGELAAWLDDFMTRMFDHQPKPKDVIFSPNKPHPVVTLTGGLKDVEDVLLGGGQVTERIARAMIHQAANPLVDRLIEENGGSLRRLDLDLAFRTRAGRRCRVNIADSFDIEEDHGPLITMRLLPPKPWTLADLPLPRAVLETCVNTRMGLVLICGTTGSGKSTTMGVLIDYLLKKKSVNFLTIENPIETLFPARDYPRSIISQRELGKHTRSSNRGLESAVRQTLSMAMVGEIRNANDAEMALDLAQSGHLIFATVHAGSVGESIRRIVDMFPSGQEKKIREQLATQYRMGMAQILVKGVHGQTELVLEVMRTNPDIQALILNQQPPDRELTMRELLEQHSHDGNRSLDMALIGLMKEGRINEDTVMYNSPDPASLVLRQHKLGANLSRRWDPTGALIEKDMSDALTLQLVDD